MATSSLDFFINPKVNTTSMTQVQKIAFKSTQAIDKFKRTGTKAYSKVAKSAKFVTTQQKKLNSRFNKGTSAFTKMAGVAGAYFSASAIKDFYSESIDGAKMQIEAETKLAAVLKNVNGLHGDTKAISQGTKMLKSYASELQEVGVIGDEVTLAGQSQLATFNLMPSTIKQLSSGMLDVIANTKGLKGTQGDAMNVANMLGKAMMGQASALTRVGITMTDAQTELIKTGTEEQRAAVLAKVLQQNVGGVNKALAKTDAGKIQNTANAWGDVKEQVGMGVLPIMAKFAKIMKDNMPQIQESIKGVTSALVATVETLYKYRTPILALIGAYAIFNTAIKINAAILAIQAHKTVIAGIATKAFTAGQWLLNAALTANPIGLVIAGVALLGAGFVLAYKKIKPFRDFIDDLWKKLSNSYFGKLVGKMFSGSGASVTVTEKTVASGGYSQASTGGTVSNFQTSNQTTKNTNINQNITVNGGLNSSDLSTKIKKVVNEHNRQELASMGAD